MKTNGKTTKDKREMDQNEQNWTMTASIHYTKMNDP
jgi:hypothetical protein